MWPCPSIGISVYLLDSSYNDNKQALIREQQAEAKALAGRIDQTLVVIADRLRSMQGQGLNRESLESLLLPLVKGTFAPLTAFYVDRRGSTVAAVGLYEELAGLKDAELERAVQDTYIGPMHEVTVSSVSLLSLPVFTIATPENYGGGVIALVMSGQSFEPIFTEARFNRGYAYAVSRSGKTLSYPVSVYTPPGGRGDEPLPNASGLVQVTKALRSPDAVGSATGVNLRQRKVLSAWATVPSTGWKVFVEQPESAAFAPLRGKIWKTVLLIAAFVAAAVALSILLARRLVRPIKRMRLAAAGIGAGAYDERIELSPRRPGVPPSGPSTASTPGGVVDPQRKWPWKSPSQSVAARTTSVRSPRT